MPNLLTFSFAKLKQSRSKLPVALSRIPAGFPSPADDYLEDTISFDELLIKNKPATYIMKVAGDSMIDAGVYSGDLLVVDRSLKPIHGKMVVACIDGEYTLKTFSYIGNTIILKAQNPHYADITLSEEQELTIFGVVTAIIRITH